MSLHSELDLIDYKALYNEAPVGYFTSDASGYIVNTNNKFLALLGLTREEVVHKIRFQTLLTMGGKIYYETHYVPLLQMQGSVNEINFDIVNADKSKVPILINTTKILSEDGKQVYWQSTVFDIIQRKRYEQELISSKKKAEELSEELISINKELNTQSDIIRKQNVALEKINLVKDKFFIVVAHDLRNPLIQLHSFVQLIERHADILSKEQLKEISLDLKSSLNNTLGLADNLIVWARSQMKEFSAQQRNVNIQEIVKHLILMNDDFAKSKTITLNYTFDSTKDIVTDRDQLTFILRNLIMNAIKFTPKNGSVKVDVFEKNSDTITINISDNGIGMSKELKESLSLKTAKNSSHGTMGEKGSGLGLSLVYEFVEMNNGTIDVISEKDKGTTFSVTLKSAEPQLSLSS
ncbi:MAG: PAS domain S-box-containing protein [Cyclobacteriaceae bacterium]|jgi:PAS domain S-box-containing protein